jgi:hypothetical protein
MDELSQPTKALAPYTAYQVQEHGKQRYWKRIGAAWTHKDSPGFSVKIESLPLDGRITLRIISDEKRAKSN